MGVKASVVPVEGIGYLETLFCFQGGDKWTRRIMRMGVQAVSVGDYLSEGIL